MFNRIVTIANDVATVGICVVTSWSVRLPSGVRPDGIFPDDDAIGRFIDADLSGQNQACAIRLACHMTLETIAPMGDDPAISLPAIAG